MKRLLCIVSSMDVGGAETFLMKVYRHLDRTKYQMDFCVSKRTKSFYDDEIDKLGGKIFYVKPKSKNFFDNFLSIKKIVKQENYRYVLRTSQQSFAAIDLLAAKLGGAKTLIYRSSNAGMTGSRWKIIFHKQFRFLPNMIANVKIAPSTEAAQYVFGKRTIKQKKVYLLHNALEYSEYQYNPIIREQMRERLGLKNKLVIGHIGRFAQQKNHHFLIEIFSELYKKNPNSRLLLIGEGALEDEIKTQIRRLHLENAVYLLGVRKDISALMMAMDLYLFPSFYEGMPNTIIEAQAAGLKCLLSDTITKEADITGLLKYISLKKDAKNWADIILEEKNYTRKSTKNFFEESGYTMDSIIEKWIHLTFH